MIRIRLCKLINDTLAAYQALGGASAKTCSDYRAWGFNPIMSYFDQHGQKNYSEALVTEFLAPIREQYLQNKISQFKYRYPRKAGALLDEYHRTGTLVRSNLPRTTFVDLSAQYFKTILAEYSAEVVNSGRMAKTTSDTYRNSIRPFLRYLEKHGHKDFEHLSLKNVSDYISNCINCPSNQIFALKSFLVFLNERKITDNLTAAIQFTSVKRKKKEAA